MKEIAMKSTLIVALLSFLLADSAIAGVGARGKEVEGHVAAADNHVVMFWLSGGMAEATYNYMEEEPKENLGSCIGTIKQFPGLLCSKGKKSFACFMKINLEKGELDGNADELCEHRINTTKKSPITAQSMYVDDEGASLTLVENTAKIVYNKMTVKPRKSGSCLGGSVKWFDGLECTKSKNQYKCLINIKLKAKKIETLGEACPEEDE
jgi:hypothetical protein